MKWFYNVATSLWLMWVTPCIQSCKVTIGHFAVMYLVAKPMTWSEAEGDHIEIETTQSNLHLKSSNICILTRSTSVLLPFKGLATKHSNRAWGIEPQTCDALPLSHKDSTVSKVLRIFSLSHAHEKTKNIFL